MDEKQLNKLKDLKKNNPPEYLKILHFYKDSDPELYQEIVKVLGDGSEEKEKESTEDQTPESAPVIDREPFMLDTSEMAEEEIKKKKEEKNNNTNWTLIILLVLLVLVVLGFIVLVYVNPLQ